jgi:hypothetical protein
MKTMHKSNGQIVILKSINTDEVTVKLILDEQEFNIDLTSTEFTNALFGKLTKCLVEKI